MQRQWQEQNFSLIPSLDLPTIDFSFSPCSFDIPLFSLDLSMYRFVYLFFLSRSRFDPMPTLTIYPSVAFFIVENIIHFFDLSQLHRYLLIRPSADVNLCCSTRCDLSRISLLCSSSYCYERILRNLSRINIPKKRKPWSLKRHAEA